MSPRRQEFIERVTDEYARSVNRLTNHQRNLWARAGYPGAEHRELEPLYRFVPPPKLQKPKRFKQKVNAKARAVAVAVAS